MVTDTCENVPAKMYGECMIKQLNGNQFWLLKHQITAFWHGFGLSNGIDLDPETDLEIWRGDNGERRARIKPQAMQRQLKDYLKWLNSYADSWDSTTPSNVSLGLEMFPDGYDSFLKGESFDKSRSEILEMIELLQDRPPRLTTEQTPMDTKGSNGVNTW